MLRHIWEWVGYIIPAISNYILVGLGIVIALPKFAECLKKRPGWWRALAIVCIVCGLIAVVSDIVQRRSNDQTTKEQIQATKVLVGQTRDVLKDTGTLLTQTQTVVNGNTQAINSLSLLITRTDDLHRKFLEYTAKSENARRLGDKQMAKFFANQAAEILVSDAAPAVVDRMQRLLEQWSARDKELRKQNPSKYQYWPASQKLAEEYQPTLRPIMASADWVQERLIEVIPEDRRKGPLSFRRQYLEEGRTLSLDQFGAEVRNFNRFLAQVSQALSVSD